MRGARHEVGIVRGIRGRNGVISEAACEAVVRILCAIGEGRE